MLSSLQDRAYISTLSHSVNHISTHFDIQPLSSFTSKFSGNAIPSSVFNISSKPHISPSSFWLIDMGATDHMVSNLTLLTTITSTIRIEVKLPNDQHVVATHISTVYLVEGFVLTNVLCIPHFSINLVSTSKITSDLSSCLIFLHGHYYIQDLTHWRTIEIAKLHQGLYQLL